MAPIINKTMARADLAAPAAARVVADLDRIVEGLDACGSPPSSWYGTLEMSEDPTSWERVNRGYGYQPLPGAADDRRFPWFLYWEIAWLVLNNRFLAGERLLDLGGSASLFSCYAAAQGLDVVTVDLDEYLVAHAEKITAATGWSMQSLQMDMRELELEGRSTTSPPYVSTSTSRWRADRGQRRVGELLRPGGSFSVTFDYRNPSRLAQISSPAAVEEQFVTASGLRVRGNPEFHDTGESYLLHPFHHPSAARARGWQEAAIRLGQFDFGERGQARQENEYTFGALFLERA